MSYIELWNECFGDEKEFAEEYLKNVVDRSYGIFEGEKAISMAHVIFKNTIIDGRRVKSAFVIGVATHPKYRGGGLQKRIFKEMESEVLKEAELIQLATYIPEFYKKMGYVETGMLLKCAAQPIKTNLKVCRANEHDMRRCYSEYMCKKSGYFERGEFLRLKEADDAICIYGDDIQGYCIFSNNVVLEAVFLSREAAEEAACYSKKTLEFLAPYEIARQRGFCIVGAASVHMAKPAQNIRFCNIDEY